MPHRVESWWIKRNIKIYNYIIWQEWVTYKQAISTYNTKILTGLNLRSDITPTLLTYLLTYSMVQSLSWEANWFASSQEIPRISRNPKVHYRTHKRPPPVPILGQPNPVRIPTSYLLEIHPNIIHPSTPRSPQWLFPSGFPAKNLYTPSPYPYAPHAQPISFFSILSPAQ